MTQCVKFFPRYPPSTQILINTGTFYQLSLLFARLQKYTRLILKSATARTQGLIFRLQVCILLVIEGVIQQKCV
jgi:hypothetical protein